MAAASTDLSDRLLAYEAWANARIFAAVKQIPHDRNQRALLLLAHIANAMRTWVDRIQQVGVTPDPWRDLTMEECGDELRTQHERLATMVRAQRKALQQPISYRTTEGKHYDTPLLDILLQLAFHSHYHRGQINAAIRETGGAPVNVDFITYVREGI
jgi:uncharacterized damage-inducible protein DinB